MGYRLTARDRVFCEGTLAECQKSFTELSQMISAGINTDFQIEEFSIDIDSVVRDSSIPPSDSNEETI
jgi:hypothetical protein